MNDQFDPSDGLLNSLVEESITLPLAAAAQARAQQHARKRASRIVAVLAMSLLGAGIWFTRQSPDQESSGRIVSTPSHSETAKASDQGYVKVHQAGEAFEVDLIPPGVSEREMRLLAELPGVPLLIVRNEAGDVASVHIFER